MRRRVLVVVVAFAVACSRPARPRDGEPAAVPSRRGDAAVATASPDVASSSVAAGASQDGAPVHDARPGADAVAIVDAPIAWTAEREQLTLAYRRQHSDPDAADLVIEPRAIVLHYTAGGSAAATRRYFDPARIEAGRKELAAAGAVNVSAHFLVDRDGTIYQLQPPTRFARHCIGLNHIAVGIENVGDEAKFPLTEAQVVADAALVRELARRYSITHLLGHHEVMRFRDHPYHVERDPAYRNTKSDPGPRFMARVRAEVADLGLRGLEPE
jgi:N-acetylmuramoyl-L-alanine amidase